MTNKIPEHWPAMKRAYELTLAQGTKSATEWDREKGGWEVRRERH